MASRNEISRRSLQLPNCVVINNSSKCKAPFRLVSLVPGLLLNFISALSSLLPDLMMSNPWSALHKSMPYGYVLRIIHVYKKRQNKLRGVACEKPLARNVGEAEQITHLMIKEDITTGYLENQLFSPVLIKGRDLLWKRAVPSSGRPYLVRAAEEHSGPHKPWFWKGQLQGGGVLSDMMCHSLEAARFLLQDPKKEKDSLEAVSVQATIASLKWSQDSYSRELKESTNNEVRRETRDGSHSNEVDYSISPSEDYAHVTITYKDSDGRTLIGELTTSWSYVGSGLRLSFELLGPEYSMRADTLETPLHIFMSRRIRGDCGEDLIEKQNAEQGLMPVVVDEEIAYGYTGENRHMVECFRSGKTPSLTFEDGLRVVKMMMVCYYAAEKGTSVDPRSLPHDFSPLVAQGRWTPP
ncbi:oxidoreductase-like protein [Planoprotostelium fungivorum]|uniref:Oxidoreductase-like protein n=1 Tax=Planoprotostelium fungivorum TaxID=1890364 RepID=A0A2P6MYF0_9EUKA|nr:oxidoreductase-like protein [Planoprotostelium fungivorum]